VRSDDGVTPSTRYRDLVDLALIASRQQVDAAGVRTAILSETTRRGLRLPARFDVPDAATWRPGYQALAAKTPALGPLRDFDAAVDLVRRLVDPVLAGPITARWDPARAVWRPHN
jgi:nucleotidyltransferase AbiEii toxin of type IV toxin-antitoxin system